MTMIMAMMTAVVVTVTAAVTIDNVAIRLGLPDGRGLSGVCLFRNGPGERRRVMFKSVGSARINRRGGAGDYVVAGDLTADRVYEGTFARLEDGDQVARFGCNGGQRFEIATPFVVPERDLAGMLAVRESIERRFGPQPSRQVHSNRSRPVTAEHVSVTLRGLRRASTTATGHRVDDDATVTVDVFQLYKKPNVTGGWSWDSNASNVAAHYSAYPYARYALRYPIGNLVLADLPPDQMLAVKYRRSVPSDNENLTVVNSLFIYTGGLYPLGTANLTRMLDESAAGADIPTAGPKDDTADGTDTDIEAAASSHQIDGRLAHHDSYGKHNRAVQTRASAKHLAGIGRGPCKVKSKNVI